MISEDNIKSSYKTMRNCKSNSRNSRHWFKKAYHILYENIGTIQVLNPEI